MIGAAISGLLSNDPAVSAIVGSRIYPQVATQGASEPYVVYLVVDQTTTAAAAGDCGLDKEKVQISCFGKNYGQVVGLTAAIRKVLNGYTGEAYGVRIAHCQHVGGRESYETDAQLYHRSTDYRFQIHT